jgi:Caspase domain
MNRIITLSLLLAGSVSAQEWPSLGSNPKGLGLGAKDAAVVVGVSDYAALPDISGAADNATDWYDYLVNTRGVPDTRIHLLRDSDAAKEEVEAKVKQAAVEVEEGGVLWFVFIGHGAPNKEHTDGLMMSYDAQPTENSMTARGLPQKSVLALMDAGRHARAIAIFDACFSGRTDDGKQLDPQSQATVPVRRIDTAAQRTTILSASDETAGALINHNRPAFSYMMLGALRGWADADKDRRVTIMEAFRLTNDKLITLVKGRTQKPSIAGVQDDFVLADGVSDSGPEFSQFRKMRVTSPFQGNRLDVPSIDTTRFANNGLDQINISAEKALDRAKRAQSGENVLTAEKVDSWCALAAIEEKNAYLDEAKKACDQWRGYQAEENKLQESMANDYNTLADYMDLDRSSEEKLNVVKLFLQTYGPYASRQEVLAAKNVEANLQSGRSPDAARDNDKDGLFIDSCPNEAEDKDGDADDDGCPDTPMELPDLDGLFGFPAIAFDQFDVTLGLSAGTGIYDQKGVPTKFAQFDIRPWLGLNTRLRWAFLEVGTSGDWDLSRDIDDGALSLTPFIGLRAIRIGPWTPSVGVEYQNVFDLVSNRRGGPAVYVANSFSLGGVIDVRLVYHYGLGDIGSFVPVHALSLELHALLFSPGQESLLLNLIGMCGE